MKQLDLLIRLYNNQLFFDEMTAEVLYTYRDVLIIYFIHRCICVWNIRIKINNKLEKTRETKINIEI